MTERLKLNRLFWHSRRGMLELDLLLVPFVREAYPHLDKADQARYLELLACEDQDLFAWFMQRTQPDNAGLQAIIRLILQHAASRNAV